MSETNFKNRGEQVFETLKREILDLIWLWTKLKV